ncbi:MAG: YicC family protein [Bacteroidaceae bacterium]|nr:YicC family protein [Bacteroidaceae bacterium]
MIQSMTGYGKAVAEIGEKKIIVEIKSLNSKAMDLSTRITPLFKEKELEIRSIVTTVLERGKVDLCIYLDSGNTTNAQSINKVVFKNYLQQIKEIAESENLDMPQDWFQTILRMPDIYSTTQQEEISENDWNTLKKAIEDAVNALVEYRKTEGAALEVKFREKISNISDLLASVNQYETARVSKIKDRIKNALVEHVGADYDTNRFEQELIYYIEKLDINEEKQRLTNHLDYFIKTIEDEKGQGKKLGFIAQEMGREINTLGSKSNLAELQNIVVMMKDELEQIKEQVLNVM